MPPGRKPTRSQQEFVDAAIAFADEHGIDAITLRALGSAMGASASAVYRYFDDKEALYSAMRDHMLGEAMADLDGVEDPARLIRAFAHAYRRKAKEHPCLSQLMILSRLSGDQAAAVPALVAGSLESLGLRGPLIVRGYRQLETFVAGSAAFDFADAPRHLHERLERMHAVGRKDFARAMPDTAGVDKVNEAAFTASLDAILDSLIAQGRGQQ